MRKAPISELSPSHPRCHPRLCLPLPAPTAAARLRPVFSSIAQQRLPPLQLRRQLRRRCHRGSTTRTRACAEASALRAEKRPAAGVTPPVALVAQLARLPFSMATTATTALRVTTREIGACGGSCVAAAATRRPRRTAPAATCAAASRAAELSTLRAPRTTTQAATAQREGTGAGVGVALLLPPRRPSSSRATSSAAAPPSSPRVRGSSGCATGCSAPARRPPYTCPRRVGGWEGRYNHIPAAETHAPLRPRRRWTTRSSSCGSPTTSSSG